MIYIFSKIAVFFFLFACSSLPESRSEMNPLKNRPLSQQVKAFRSDGCSRWPEGTDKNPHKWLGCCFRHDIAYWMGGTRSERKSADKLFQQCVGRVSEGTTKRFMYWGVRLGGSPRFDTSYKWGYGWIYDRGYIELSSEEKKYLREQLPREGDNMLRYVSLEKISSPEILPTYIEVSPINLPQL